MNLLRKIVLVGMVAGALAFGSGVGAGPLATFNTIAGNGSLATAYFVGFSASDTDALSIVGESDDLFINQLTVIGTPVVLGTFGNGVEIQFEMTDHSVANTFFTGSGFRNSDHYVHALVTMNIHEIVGLPSASYTFATNLQVTHPGTVFVGFEDRPGNQADFDYNDLVFAVVNARPLQLLVPEPTTLALIGLALVVLYRFRRKRD